jgi:hypothetical protein
MNCILLSFLLINALFWGLFPHSAHCQVVKQFNKLLGLSIQCPSHKIHLALGVLFFISAVYVSQKESKDL